MMVNKLANGGGQVNKLVFMLGDQQASDQPINGSISDTISLLLLKLRMVKNHSKGS